MSRAFVKEDDGSRPSPLPDLPVSDAPNLVTARGLALIEAKLSELQAALAATELAEGQVRLRRELRYWSARHATARPTPVEPGRCDVHFGCRVTYRDRSSAADVAPLVIEIVGEDEADPAAGRIAYTAPIARALLGLETGDRAPFRAGGRNCDLEVLEVTASPR